MLVTLFTVPDIARIQITVLSQHHLVQYLKSYKLILEIINRRNL